MTTPGGAAEERFHELVDSFAKQQRDNEKLKQEIKVLKLKLQSKMSECILL